MHETIYIANFETDDAVDILWLEVQAFRTTKFLCYMYRVARDEPTQYISGREDLRKF